MGTGAWEHEISHCRSGPLLKPSSHSRGLRCAPAMGGHPGPGGGAGWGGVGVEPCARHSPISGATRQAYASFWPGEGPRQLSLAKRAIPDWLRPRLPPPPPGGGTWVRVCGSCCLRGSRSPTSWPPQSLVRFFTRLQALGVRRPGNSWSLRTEHQDRWRWL